MFRKLDTEDLGQIVIGSTMLSVSIGLLSLDTLPLVDDILGSIKKIIVVTLLVSMGGVVIDSLDKE